MRQGLLFFLVASAAYGLECGYDGKNFWVREASAVHTHGVAANFADTRVSCGQKIAVVYDGDEMTVYDAGLGKFQWRNSANGFKAAPVSVGPSLAGLYDGDSFLVYDAGRSVFAETKAASNFYWAQSAASRTAVSFYDGESFVVYDAARGDFTRETAQKRNPDTRLVSGDRLTVFYDGSDLMVYDGNRGRVARQSVALTRFSTLQVGHRDVFFYDGKKLVGFCAETRSFATLPVEFDAFTHGFVDKTSGRLSITVKKRNYSLDPVGCRIEASTGLQN